LLNIKVTLQSDKAKANNCASVKTKELAKDQINKGKQRVYLRDTLGCSRQSARCYVVGSCAF